MSTRIRATTIALALACAPALPAARGIELDLFGIDPVLTPKIALRERYRERAAPGSEGGVQTASRANLSLTARLRGSFPLVVTPDTAFSVSAGDFFFEATFADARFFDPAKRTAVFRIADENATGPSPKKGRIVVRWTREKLRVSLSTSVVPGIASDLFSEVGSGTFAAPLLVGVGIGDAADERIAALLATQEISQEIVDGGLAPLRKTRITGALDRTPPSLSLSVPATSQTSEDFFDLSGKVSDLSEVVVDVFLNGELEEEEIFPDEDFDTGEMVFLVEGLALEPGENRIRVVARDENGNFSAREVRVEFTPEDDAAVAP
jgi:hypothetical protein